MPHKVAAVRQPADRFVRTNDLVAELGISRATLYRWTKSRGFPLESVGPATSGAWRSRVNQWIEVNCKPASAA